MPNKKVSAMTAILAADLQPTDLWMVARPDQESFKMLHSEFIALINSLASSQINVARTIFVDPDYGDDGTALPYREDKPFQSADAAALVAQYGDTIRLRAGDHFFFTTAAIDGVRWYSEPGADCYVFTTLLNFDTTTGGVVATTPFYWQGYGRIMQCTGPIINVKANPSAVINFECNSLNGNNLSNGILPQDGLINLTVREDYISAGRNFSPRTGGKLVARIGGKCLCTFANVFNGNVWSSGAAYSGELDIEAGAFELPTSAVGGDFSHVYMDNLQSPKIRMRINKLIDTSAVAQAAIRIGNGGAATGADVDIQIDYASTVRPLYRIQQATAEVILQFNKVKDSGTSLIQAGVTVLKNSLQKALAVIPISVTGGTLSLMGSTIVSNGVLATIDNSAGTVISEGSKGNVAPTNPVTGNYYINAAYTN